MAEEWTTYFANGATRDAANITGGWKGESPGSSIGHRANDFQVLYMQTLPTLTRAQHTTSLRRTILI